MLMEENAMMSIWSKASRTFISATSAVVFVLAVGGTAGAQTTASNDESLTIEAVPESVRENYRGFENIVKIHESAYTDYTPKSEPHTWCMSESYTGNTWRKNHISALEKLVSQLKSEGRATDELRVTDSNGDTALQISQVNTLVNAGCDVLIILPASPVALCDAISSAKSQGVLVVTSDTAVDCKDVINVSRNSFLSMTAVTGALAKAMGGKGSVLIVTGYPGTKGVGVLGGAIDAALAPYPDIKIVGTVAGNWTPSVAQSAVATFLSTHPADIDGVIEMGEMGVAAENAFEQSGREPVLVTAASGECAAFAYWKEHPGITPMASVQAPEAAAYETFHVTMRMLAGQQPVINTMLYPTPLVTEENFDEFYDPSMTVSSTCYPRSPDGRAVPDSYFDVFFTGGEPVDTNPPPAN
jgi:ribose transport system substrate-binding protein